MICLQNVFTFQTWCDGVLGSTPHQMEHQRKTLVTSKYWGRPFFVGYKLCCITFVSVIKPLQKGSSNVLPCVCGHHVYVMACAIMLTWVIAWLIFLMNVKQVSRTKKENVSDWCKFTAHLNQLTLFVVTVRWYIKCIPKRAVECCKEHVFLWSQLDCLHRQIVVPFEMAVRKSEVTKQKTTTSAKKWLVGHTQSCSWIYAAAIFRWIPSTNAFGWPMGSPVLILENVSATRGSASSFDNESLLVMREILIYYQP